MATYRSQYDLKYLLQEKWIIGLLASQLLLFILVIVFRKKSAFQASVFFSSGKCLFVSAFPSSRSLIFTELNVYAVSYFSLLSLMFLQLQ